MGGGFRPRMEII